MLIFDDSFHPIDEPSMLGDSSRWTWLRSRLRLLAFHCTPRTRVARVLVAGWIIATATLFGLGGASAVQVEAVPATVVATLSDGGCILIWRDGGDNARTTWLSSCPAGTATGSEVVVHRSPVWDGAPFWDGAELQRAAEVWRSLIGLPLIGSLMLGGMALLGWAARRSAPLPGASGGLRGRLRRRDRPA